MKNKIINPNKKYEFFYEVDLQQWDYKETIKVSCGGNMSGLEVIIGAIEFYLDDHNEVILTRENGDTLSVDLTREDDLKELVVGVRLINFKLERN